MAAFKAADTYIAPGDFVQLGTGLSIDAVGQAVDAGNGGHKKLLQVRVNHSAGVSTYFQECGIRQLTTDVVAGLVSRITDDAVPKLEAAGFVCATDATEVLVYGTVTRKLAVYVSATVDA